MQRLPIGRDGIRTAAALSTLLAATVLAAVATTDAAHAATDCQAPATPQADSQEERGEGTRARLLAFLDDLDSLAGNFEQRVTDPQGRELEQSSGKVYLSFPDQFRWDYLEPYEQHIVADGERVWVHDVELLQVQVREQATAENRSPMAVLANTKLLDERFNTEPIGERDGLDWLELVPRDQEGDFSRIELGVDDGVLKRMLLVDRFDQRTDIRFSDLRCNPDLDPELFTFTPPDNVDVIGEAAELPAQSLAQPPTQSEER